MNSVRVLGLLTLLLAGCVGHIEGFTDASDVPRDDAAICATGQMACGTPAACVNLQSDPAHCGACGNACASGELCSSGACGATCAMTACGAACVDLQSDPSHCGACATVCAAGQSCAAGACRCPTGRTACGAACVDTATDPANCGTCGRSCATGQSCSAGVCGTTCAMTVCAGACVNLQSDAMHCGTCTTVCGAGHACVAGACACPAGQTDCGGTCVNTATNSANCATCGHACAAGQTCVASACACGAGLMACGGACVNTGNDLANCGTCGHACAAGEACAAGTCMTPPVCPGPPAGATAGQAAALNLENMVRVAMGIPCATMVATINLGATRHCAYYASNVGMATCVANAHVEVSTCPMYNAAQFSTRMTMAGYTGSPAFEDMAFSNNGAGAVQQWIDSVWHRTPVLSPWVRDIGYGAATGCDTMDFGVGAATPSSVVATYPYANQTGVPTSFDGTREGPRPPAPPTGWPSGYPIHIYLRGGTVTTHELTVASSGTIVPHVWIGTADASAMGLLPNANVMYANTALGAATRYHVHIVGTNAAGPVTLDWDFTTR